MPANYHPSDTTEIVKLEFVFYLVSNENNRRELNRGGPPSGSLRSSFRDNRIGLSSEARVWVESRNNRWLITDGQQNFLIRAEGNRLNVYKRPTIENCTLEYHCFLEIDPPNKIERIDFPRYIQPPDPHLIAQLRERQTRQLVHFAERDIKLYCIQATIDWRLIVGLGGEHVQETNMTLHHIYGIPYIPGSAVKGVLRHWWLNEDFQDEETKALKNPDFLEVFGSQEQRGEVQFLDAYPEKVRFATDIMNPHYPDYYGGSKPPTDFQNPVPINFLTVEKTTFRFVFLAKAQRSLDKLKERFQGALKLKGIGAKTAVGYGYFRDFKDLTV